MVIQIKNIVYIIDVFMISVSLPVSLRYMFWIYRESLQKCIVMGYTVVPFENRICTAFSSDTKAIIIINIHYIIKAVFVLNVFLIYRLQN